MEGTNIGQACRSHRTAQPTTALTGRLRILRDWAARCIPPAETTQKPPPKGASPARRFSNTRSGNAPEQVFHHRLHSSLTHTHADAFAVQKRSLRNRFTAIPSPPHLQRTPAMTRYCCVIVL